MLQAITLGSVRHLTAVLLVLSMSTVWAAPLAASLLERESGMGCCKRGSVHTCCKRKAPAGPALAAQRPCGDGCSLPVSSAAPAAFALAPAATWIANLRAGRLPSLAAGVAVPPRLLAHSLHQRPPPSR
ncbi:MAG: hypothetical protein R2729_18575 [Bryobacteraceae bacterium]